MGVNKVKYGNNTVIDISNDTVTPDKLLQGYTAHDNTGALITGTATGGSGDGYVWQDANGYVHLSNEEGTLPIVDSLTVNGSGTYTAQSGHVYNPVIVPGGTATAPSTISGTSATVSTGTNTLTLSKTVSNTPQVTAGYIASGTAGNTSVSLTASVNTRSSTDLSVSGATVTAPSGYYGSNASKTVASGTAGTPTATKGTVSNHSISVTPSVTNTTGYITGSTKTGTAVSVSASELVSGNLAITQNGTGINVANYSTVSVDVSGGGGASNLVIGTFTGTTAGSAMNVTIPYAGSGYPILIEIEPSGGYSKSGMVNVVQRYAVIYHLLSKCDITTSPSYSAGTGDTYMATTVYKSSSTEAENVSRNGSYPTNTYSNSSGTATASNQGGVVYIHSATEMSVFIAGTSYGFRANTEYTYRIIYSS